jgi:PhzF family phenazine biosynthesis protein
MAVPLIKVDAFAAEPFGGNPAAICLLPAPADAGWMQRVAQEMGHSETAFITPPADGAFGLRWFTPTVEVDLCGHATLAGAHVLWESGRLKPGEAARFETRGGLLTCRRGADGWIEMDFPTKPAEPRPGVDALPIALGTRAAYIGKNGMDYLVEVADEKTVRTLKPDIARLATLPVRGVIVTARAEAGPYDFVSRFFAPAAGVPEDPVTGSAHCCLAPYWSERLGKRDLLAYQASARGGVVRAGVRGDRVLIAGQAVTVLRGELVA